jgi:hypothetical protein
MAGLMGGERDQGEGAQQIHRAPPGGERLEHAIGDGDARCGIELAQHRAPQRPPARGQRLLGLLPE